MVRPQLAHKHRIEEAIHDAERETSAEFVVALVLSPGIYWPYFISLVIGAGMLVFGAFYFFASWPDATKAMTFAFIAMIVLAYLLLESHLLHRLVPGQKKMALLERMAKDIFIDTGLGELPRRNGLLLLVLRDERLVHVTTGEGLLQLTGKDVWLEIVARFVEDARHKPLEDAVINAVSSFGAQLKNYFPKMKGEGNLVSNRLMIL